MDSVGKIKNPACFGEDSRAYSNMAVKTGSCWAKSPEPTPKTVGDPGRPQPSPTCVKLIVGEGVLRAADDRPTKTDEDSSSRFKSS